MRREEREQDHRAQRQQDEPEEGFAGADEPAFESCGSEKHRSRAILLRAGIRRLWIGGIVFRLRRTP